jgi:RNA polymerase sigma-70 factor, ECF subfamily
MNRFRQFYTDNKDKLFGYLLRKTGSSHVAADLVQDAFVRYLEKYRNRERSPALLFTIGRNLFFDHVRQDRWTNVQDDEICQASVANQEDAYIARERSNKVFAAMALLGDEEREILALVVGSDLNYREIADIRKCTVANIKVKVHRARQKLRQLLKEHDNE